MSERDRQLLAAFQEHHELGDEIRRKHGPITAEQIRRFRRSPDVIIPEGTVGLVHESRLAEASARDFCRTPNGQLAFAWTKGDSRLEVLGESPLTVALDPHGKCSLVCVIGEDPLWIDRRRDEEYVLKLGLHEIARKKGIANVTVNRDGTISFTHGGSGFTHRYIVTWTKGELRSEDTGLEGIRRLYQTPDHEMWMLTADGGNVFRMSSQGLQFVRGGSVLDFAESSDGQVVCFVRASEESVSLETKTPTFSAGHWEIGRTPYLSSCVQFRNKVWAYIGRVSHDQQCWVIGGTPRPAFRWVSSIFEDPKHGPCYWGLCGEYLLTMRVRT